MILPRIIAKKSLFGFATALLLIPSIIFAQIATTCPDIVNTAILAADELCADLGRNTICYGSFHLETTPQDGVSRWLFEQVGDMEDVNNLAQLKLSPMNESTGEWGVAIMALQANLPNTLPGQNVTFILFGDVTIENAATPEQVENGEFTPMQAFYLTTGIGDANCAEAPDSGMLVQTPKGIGAVNFVVNGVEVAMGSTVYFQATSRTQLMATTLEGMAVLTADNIHYPILAGTRFGIEKLADTFVPLTDSIESYNDTLDRLSVLPFNLLERNIDIHLPFDDSDLALLQERIETGQLLCGTPPFPPCNELPASLGGQMCVFPENYENNLVPLELAQNPICEASAFYGRPAPDETPPAPTNNNNNDGDNDDDNDDDDDDD